MFGGCQDAIEAIVATANVPGCYSLQQP